MNQVSDKIKVLIEGYSAEGHTSFGSQIRELWKRLLGTGKYQIVQHGWFHTAHIEKAPWQIIPTNNSWDDQGRPIFMAEDKWGQKSFVRVCSQTKPDLVWTLADTYMTEHMAKMRRQLDYKFIQYMPLDGAPPPLRYKEWMTEADASVAVCKWGAEIMEKMCGRPFPYIYHGVDTDTFVPYPPARKAEIRRASTGNRLGPDAKIIGWVGKDQTRKQPWNLFELVHYLLYGEYHTCNKCHRVTKHPYDKQLRKTITPKDKQCRWCLSKDVTQGQPQDVYFWCHAYNQPQQAWDFNRLIADWKLEDRVIFTTTLSRDSGLSTSEIVDLYNCFDVFVSLSGGEGFCIPLCEAQSCGIPVLYTNYSGQIEICTSGGLPVDNESFVPEPMTHIDRAVASIEHCIQQYNTLFSKDQKLYKKLRTGGRVRMIDDFNWDSLAQQWDTLITKTLQDSVSLIGVPS